jgi:hypothetical protein
VNPAGLGTASKADGCRKALGVRTSTLRVEEYMLKALKVHASQYDGENLGDIIAIVSQNAVNVTDNGTLQIKNTAKEWVTVQPDWWVIKHQNGEIEVSSDPSFDRRVR